MLSQRFSFKLRAYKHKSSKAIRNWWYAIIRIPAGQLAWVLWRSSPLISDRILSRRNGIRVFGHLTFVEIPPNSIKRFVLDEDVKRKFMIWPGGWDERARLLKEHYRHTLMQDLWQNRNKIEKSENYRYLIEKIEAGEPLTRVNKSTLVDTPQKARKYLLNQLGIFYSLESKGYKPDLADDELNVAIARDGSLIKANGGRKRLIAAQILGLPTIPVRVAYVHKSWLAQHTKQGVSRSQALAFAISNAKQLARDHG